MILFRSRLLPQEHSSIVRFRQLVFGFQMQQSVPDPTPQSCKPKLFPYDFAPVNHRGLRLQHRSYCLYRVAMLLSITILFTLLLLYGPELKNWAYLTYWGFTGTLLYFLLGVIDIMAIRASNNKMKLPLWKALHWLFPNLLCVELMINGVFWFVFFPFIIYYHKSKNIPLLVIDVVQAFGAHMVPLALLLIDMNNNLICFWNRRIRKYTVIILLTYLAFNMVYTIEEGPIYPVLTYRDVLTYIFVAGNVIGTLIVYEIVLALSTRFKNKTVLKILKRNAIEKEVDMPPGPKFQDFVDEAPQTVKTENILVIHEVSRTADRVRPDNVVENV